jgi:predicted dehydrogenase
MKKVRWGVLSTAKIGVEKVIPAMQQSKYCDMIAIASRNLHKAQEVSSPLGISKVYGSYEQLLSDPDIDAIYNPLPNHLHVPWSIKALQADKHVLCEKPIGLSAAEGQQLLDESRQRPNLKVMEAFMYRHHPQWKHAKQLVSAGKVGELKAIQSFFSYHNIDPGNVRNMADIGGGGLMDIGCYCISLARYLYDEEPQRVLGVIEYDPKFKTDRLASGVLDFGSGISTFTCATQLAPFQRVNIIGDKGRIEIEIPFNAPPDQPCRIWHQSGSEMNEILFDVCNQYTIQGDLFAAAVLNDTNVPTPLEDAVANMQVIENIIQSVKDREWI